MRRNHRKDERLTALKQVELFRRCSRRELADVARCSCPASFRPGERLCREGETGAQVFVVLSGRADVRRAGTVIAGVGPGEVVGELAALGGFPRTATVVATTPMEVLVLTLAEFEQVLLDAPAVAREVLTQLARRATAHVAA